MSSLKILACAGALAAAATVQARAADLGYPPPPSLPAAPAPLVDTGGWYLRGDVGASMIQDDKWSQDLSNDERTVNAIHSRGFLQKELGDSALIGVGAGYKINSWLRGDITVDYRTGRTVNGILQANENYNDDFGALDHNLQNIYGGGRLTSLVGLVNGYVDLGTWYGITPYVGAGVGVAHNRVKGMAETGGSNYAFGEGVQTVAASNISNGSKTSFAWALMAGVSYDVTQNLKLDLGYRYLNFGEAQTGVVNCNPVFCGQTAPGIRFKDLSANEFRIGLRWALNDVVPAVPYAPAPMPLVRKY